MKDDDYIEHLFVASTHDFTSCFFTTVGKVYRLKVHELPLGSRQSKWPRDRQPAAVPARGAGARSHPDARVQGSRVPSSSRRRTALSKKTKLEAYNTNLKADGIIAIKMREGDELVGARHSTGNDDAADGVARTAAACDPLLGEGRPPRWAGTRRACRACGYALADEVISINIAHNDADSARRHLAPASGARITRTITPRRQDGRDRPTDPALARRRAGWRRLVASCARLLRDAVTKTRRDGGSVGRPCLRRPFNGRRRGGDQDAASRGRAGGF